MHKPKVGFIGVGIMGWGLARNLVEKGFELSVMAHRKREAVEDLKSRGATEVATAREMAENSEFIVLCVTGTPQVENLVYRDDGILAGARNGLTVIDTSTCKPDSTARLHADLLERGILFIDAPLSRTPKHAWDGESTTFVGGTEAMVDKCRPLLETWATAIIPTGGPVGSAHAIKLVNNLVAIGYAALWSECYATVRKLGMEPKLFREIISNSGMNCMNFQNFSDYVCDGDPTSHKFTLENCLKDLGYYQELASQNRTATLMSDGAIQALKIANNLGMGQRFMPEFVEIMTHLNGQGEKP